MLIAITDQMEATLRQFITEEPVNILVTACLISDKVQKILNSYDLDESQVKVKAYEVGPETFNIDLNVAIRLPPRIEGPINIIFTKYEPDEEEP